jgi:hypothetical protein
VRQEFYGWVLAHYAVRWLLHQAASAQEQRHARLSFKGNLQILRQAQPRSGDFSPGNAKKEGRVVQAIAQKVLSNDGYANDQQKVPPHGQATKLTVHGF